MEDRHLTLVELAAGLAHVRQSPATNGRLEMIARRPAIGERDILEEGQLDLVEGLVGDNWQSRGRQQTPPREPNPETQVTLMNARFAQLVAGTRERWPLAGDQLYVDLDLGLQNLPAGTRLRIGAATVEVTAEPHTGCRKFVERFGLEAMTFANSDEGRQLCLRGINARVVQGGPIRVGDAIAKL
ncbi:MAG: MOSC domain-containing protein [Gemmatimonadota bacterium]